MDEPTTEMARFDHDGLTWILERADDGRLFMRHYGGAKAGRDQVPQSTVAERFLYAIGDEIDRWNKAGED